MEPSRFFYYKRLGVNWLTVEAIGSLVEFTKPVVLPDLIVPERPDRPGNPATVLKISQVLNGLGAEETNSPKRLSSIWDVGTKMISLLEDSGISDDPTTTSELSFVAPRFAFNGTPLPSDINGFLKSGAMAALPLIHGLQEMQKTAFSREFAEPLINPDMIGVLANFFLTMACS